MKPIDMLENVAVILCMAATIQVSFFAQDANFYIVFSLFTVSSLILATILYIKKCFAQVRLQSFFILMNAFALIKLISQ